MSLILCVDDDQHTLDMLRIALERAGHECLCAESVPEALLALETRSPDLILSDYQMPHIDGLEFLQILRRDGKDTAFILLTAFGSIDHALAAVRAGVDDYLTKPCTPEEVINRVGLALARLETRRELARLRHEADAGRTRDAMLGSSPALRRTVSVIDSVANSRATVLIQGESGTGKELIARAIHAASDRARRPFISINCAALPEGLVESVLFGHEKGAFTGALKRSEGAFERAHRGTLLLDEISEMRFALQAKLLRVLQEQEFERVGGSDPVRVDVRVIATTNRVLKEEADAGRFRPDLYYRLSVVPIVVPPLRERVGDIPLLANHFAARAAAEAGRRIDGITPDAIAMLQSHDWPGNVRELRHAVERAVLLATTPLLDASAFAVATAPAARAAAARGAGDGTGATGFTLPSLSLEEAERLVIAEALRRCNDNRTHAAAMLGIGVRTLRKKLARGSSTESDSPSS